MANRIDVELDATESDSIEKCHHHFDDFGVNRRSIAAAKHFCPNLIELAVSSLLRTLPPEHWSHVVQLHRLGKLLHVVLDVGTADGGGGLGAQAEHFVFWIQGKCAHFADPFASLLNLTKPCVDFG